MLLSFNSLFRRKVPRTPCRGDSREWWGLWLTKGGSCLPVPSSSWLLPPGTGLQVTEILIFFHKKPEIWVSEEHFLNFRSWPLTWRCCCVFHLVFCRDGAGMCPMERVCRPLAFGRGVVASDQPGLESPVSRVVTS